jgi:hypothetical protein
MGFFNILNITWKIIIVFIIVQKKSTFNTLKLFMATCFFFQQGAMSCLLYLAYTHRALSTSKKEVGNGGTCN